MNLTIVGTGYVGLVTGACFADSGHDVACVDTDEEKVRLLKAGIMPIHEPGLEELVVRNQSRGRLRFTTAIPARCDLLFICVGTPQAADGSADLSAVWQVADTIRKGGVQVQMIAVKSTCPVGTNEDLWVYWDDATTFDIPAIVTNPEFLREGSAVRDFCYPDRVVVGVREKDIRAREVMEKLYEPFGGRADGVIFMSPESAELTKYAANAFLATKLSYINEIADLCEVVGADVMEVRRGMGTDRRIGMDFLMPGPGWGGSCFPKDVAALKYLAIRGGSPVRIATQARDTNARRSLLVEETLVELLWDVSHDYAAKNTIAVWGTAFKANTDDTRESPAHRLIDRLLLDETTSIRAYDPKGIANTEREFGDRIRCTTSPYTAAEGADALVIMTEWDEFRNPDWDELRAVMRGRVILDARNVLDADEAARQGFTCAQMGRAVRCPKDKP